MSKQEQISIDQERLVESWQRTLPTLLNQADKAAVTADGANPDTIRIHITTAGHSGYTFDFACTYVDSREVKVELVDVENNETTIDERRETVQQLVEDYVRHIHECAQALKTLTNA